MDIHNYNSALWCVEVVCTATAVSEAQASQFYDLLPYVLTETFKAKSIHNITPDLSIDKVHSGLERNAAYIATSRTAVKDLLRATFPRVRCLSCDSVSLPRATSCSGCQCPLPSAIDSLPTTTVNITTTVPATPTAPPSITHTPCTPSTVPHSPPRDEFLCTPTIPSTSTAPPSPARATYDKVVHARDTLLLSKGMKPIVTSNLLIVMTRKQKRMLRRYGDIVGIDATYRTNMWGLSLYLLTVVTAQGKGYPVCFFLPSGETKEALVEVLLQVKKLVPTWEPRVMLCDKDDSELGAIATVFPRAVIVLCDFHVKQAWNRWLRASAHGVSKDDQKIVYRALCHISNAPSVAACHARIQAFETGELFEANPQLQR
ncbi:hypothetical protein CYMTET_21839 [Cymbomonas tetramitiformis]|uniref:ZSWIM1/3 RNaseH-like domain-containing protein n=1 Tax=Cymbomonas tetramitiformis TaxID=36881 RepID=A0AAE0G223_9CHLO|nr:hypothetical protein CYMTET_21839 [Cymbomonas tetramitiformis]